MKKFVQFSAILFLLAGTVFGQARYLGVYNSSIPTPCSTCHTETITSWAATGHATAMADGQENAFFGYSCVGCHTTGWDTAVDNGGADEYVSEGADNAYTITDQANFDRVKDVQCEQCHGPVGDASGNLDFGHTGRATDYSAEVCGSCHQGEHHPYYEEWQLSGHAATPSAFINRSNSDGSCMRCHFAQDFVAYLADQNYDAANFTPQGEEVVITCATCHDPHGTDNAGEIRNLPAGFENKKVCDVCHNSEIETVDVNVEPHHTTSEALDGSPNFGYQYPNETYANSPHSFLPDRCVACHVFQTSDPVGTGHKFVPRQEACQSCHSDFDLPEGSFDYRGVQTEITTLMETLAAKLDAASVEDSTTFEFKAARYNYLSVEGEGSHGIHNTKLVKKLLEDAIANFTPTGVKETNEIPMKYSLLQNYPNPFNPTTTIKFSIPEQTNVKLSVYDALGKEVAVLVNKDMNSGTYSFEWNASNMASGIYLYKIETNTFTQTMKMILMK